MKNQTDFFKLNREYAPNRISHGDESCVGKRKIARPFKKHAPIHLVLKSDRATGAMNLLTNENRIAVKRIFSEQAERFDVKIHGEQNVGNHIHAIVSCASRENFQNFLRAVTGMIARAVLKEADGNFWTQVPFTRLITGRRDYLQMLNYLMKNSVEASLGKSARQAIEEREKLARKRRSSTVRSRIVSYTAGLLGKSRAVSGRLPGQQRKAARLASFCLHEPRP